MQAWIVDTFRDARFLGNPAGVIQLEETFPATAEMQSIAARLALPTTAFVIIEDQRTCRIRWFTPEKELNLCGHATIGAAGYLYQESVGARDDELCFHTDFGEIYTRRLSGGGIALEMPSLSVTPCTPPAGLEAAFGAAIKMCARSVDDIVIELESESTVARLQPDFVALKTIPCRGHVVTAYSRRADVDFVSRSFFPALGVNEDQVCVSAHCKLAPYWAAKLDKREMSAVQLSERGGRLGLRLEGDRVHIAGTAHVRDAVAVPRV